MDDVLVEGETTVLLGRFSWQPECSRALVKIHQRPISISAGTLHCLGLECVSYSGAEYCYYDGIVRLFSLARQRG
eukprot:CAMPEP_0183375106 /NCGR_PEP_ID=MMETSP0164_2-20130417/116450_1 /TAXON_ID=221442 /ORGANISM="Coccolithus pelagicus ssp braarudi, Strain PLY182g" /LENGTH=74 /DNA_ID=CAMNT_0025552231 /DNA_START=29 /DNA_END=250 /DNA_ORIENTATION=-